MSCRWKRRQRRLDQVLSWGILKWPSVGDFGWPPGRSTLHPWRPSIGIPSKGLHWGHATRIAKQAFLAIHRLIHICLLVLPRFSLPGLRCRYADYYFSTEVLYVLGTLYPVPVSNSSSQCWDRKTGEGRVHLKGDFGYLKHHLISHEMPPTQSAKTPIRFLVFGLDLVVLYSFT